MREWGIVERGIGFRERGFPSAKKTSPQEETSLRENRQETSYQKSLEKNRSRGGD